MRELMWNQNCRGNHISTCGVYTIKVLPRNAIELYWILLVNGGTIGEFDTLEDAKTFCRLYSVISSLVKGE